MLTNLGRGPVPSARHAGYEAGEVHDAAAELAWIMPRIARWILMDFFRRVQIPQAQLFALLVIGEREGACPLGLVREQMGISAPAVSGIVDRLEKSGYIRRTSVRGDRRAVALALTGKGTRIVRRLRGVVRERWATILAGLSSAERRRLVGLMRRIAERVVPVEG